MCNVKQKVDTGLSTAGFPDPSAVMSVDDNHSLAPREHGILAVSSLAKGTEKLAKVVRLVELCGSGSIYMFPY